MSVSFIHIADHHLRETEAQLTFGYSSGYAFRRVLRHIAAHNAHRADFLVTTGDLVNDGTDAEYRAAFDYLQLEFQAVEPPGPHRVAGFGLPHLPMYFLPGNHDPRPVYLRNLFPNAAPRRWNNVAFEFGGIQFLCIDWGEQNQAVAYPEMLEFLDRQLALNTPSVIFSHHQVVPLDVGWLDAFLAAEIDGFWNIVRGRRVLGIFTGHLHQTYERTVGGIPVYGLRATTFQFALQQEKLFCLQPPHYRLVTIHDGQLDTQLYEVPL